MILSQIKTVIKYVKPFKSMINIKPKKPSELMVTTSKLNINIGKNKGSIFPKNKSNQCKYNASIPTDFLYL